MLHYRPPACPPTPRSPPSSLHHTENSAERQSRAHTHTKNNKTPLMTEKGKNCLPKHRNPLKAGDSVLISGPPGFKYCMCCIYPALKGASTPRRESRRETHLFIFPFCERELFRRWIKYYWPSDNICSPNVMFLCS